MPERYREYPPEEKKEEEPNDEDSKSTDPGDAGHYNGHQQHYTQEQWLQACGVEEDEEVEDDKSVDSIDRWAGMNWTF